MDVDGRKALPPRGSGNMPPSKGSGFSQIGSGGVSLYTTTIMYCPKFGGNPSSMKH